AQTRDVREHTRERDVVDVVARGAGERPVLPEAGHAPVHEARVARETGLGPEAEPLHHAGTESLEQPVGPFAKAQNGVGAFGSLEIHADAAAPAAPQMVGRPLAERTGPRPHDPHHLGPHVGEHHCAVGTGPDPCDLEQSDPLERPHRSSSRAPAARQDTHWAPGMEVEALKTGPRSSIWVKTSSVDFIGMEGAGAVAGAVLMLSREREWREWLQGQTAIGESGSRDHVFRSIAPHSPLESLPEGINQPGVPVRTPVSNDSLTQGPVRGPL